MTCEPPDTCLLLLSLLLLLLLALFLFISMTFFYAPASAGALSYVQAGHSWSCEVCTPGNSGRYSFFLKQITRLQQSCATHHSSAKMAVLPQTFSCGGQQCFNWIFSTVCFSVEFYIKWFQIFSSSEYMIVCYSKVSVIRNQWKLVLAKKAPYSVMPLHLPRLPGPSWGHWYVSSAVLALKVVYYPFHS